MSALRLTEPREATSPPEHRGLRRDQVRLLVADHDTITHTRFAKLGDHLAPGDLLVLNVSGTLPAALAGVRADGEPVRVHVSTRVPGRDGHWRVVELRSPDGATPTAPRYGERIALPQTAIHLTDPYAGSERLTIAHFDSPEWHGEPIRYGYAADRWPLRDYQTVYAQAPGSAEMPSAGRPFSRELIVALVARGVAFAPLRLDCGVSSPERHEPPFPEQYDVPPATMRLVDHTRRAGGRVIAVGTTVVRALETVAAGGGARGWTDLVITPERGVDAVHGLITGWHEPEASHLLMLEAIAGPEVLARSYAEAQEHGYLWHEFGDSHLIIPERARPA